MEIGVGVDVWEEAEVGRKAAELDTAGVVEGATTAALVAIGASLETPGAG